MKCLTRSQMMGKFSCRLLLTEGKKKSSKVSSLSLFATLTELLT